MLKYFVELKGEPADLEDLPLWFPDGDTYVTEENARYYLRSDGLSQCQSPENAQEVAEGLVDELYAIGVLLWPPLQRPDVDAVIEEREDGQRRRYLFVSQHESARAKDRIEFEVNGSPQAAQRPTEAQRMLTAIRSTTHVKTAMLILSDLHRTWPRLYRILEELEAELGMSVSKAGFCSDNERDRFNQSANSALAAGNDSRHAAGKFAPPRKPMSLQKATAFIAAQVQQTIRVVQSRAAP